MGSCLTNSTRPEPNIKTIINVPECDICTLPLYTKKELACKHSYHFKCIQDHVKATIESKQTSVFCPSGCGAQFKYEDIK